MCRTTNQQDRSETYHHSNWGRILRYRGHCGRRGRRWLCNHNNILQITELLNLNRRKRCNILLLSQCLNGRQEVSTLNLLREVACNLLLKSTRYVIARIAGDTRLNNWYFTLNCGLWGAADGSDVYVWQSLTDCQVGWDGWVDDLLKDRNEIFLSSQLSGAKCKGSGVWKGDLSSGRNDSIG